LTLDADAVRRHLRRHRPVAGRLSPGQLNAIKIEPNGIVLARYSNGQSKPAGQVETRHLPQPAGPAAAGRQRVVRHVCLGRPGAPACRASGNLGVLQAGVLEESNVDLTAELVAT
jgi:flagellar hook protein FlgE